MLKQSIFLIQKSVVDLVILATRILINYGLFTRSICYIWTC